MKKLLFFILNTLICVGICDAAVRDGTAVPRAKSDKNTAQSQSRISTTPKRVSSRSTVLTPRANSAPTRQAAQSRAATNTSGRGVAHSVTSVTSRPSTITARQSQTPKPTVIARAAVSETGISGTKTGAEYEQCKKTYFSCMDQFCTLKNDAYRRCSCNDRVFDLINQRETLEDANEQLTVFTENLDVVGMTAAQATAMRTSSEGEDALTADKSASKALLQAIMNSIRGEDSKVGGKYSDLNSVNISFDTSNAFGMTDAGQAIAAYNGVALYNAVYPQCRDAVKSDCTDASLQRAITAYLMAIEQDCNTVQTAIDTTQKQLKAAVREGDAMLDLARVENRQKHNSSDLSTCIAEIEQAVLSEEVCGANYHKCLDNGEYIDVSTGKPIAGVKEFYKLGGLLVFTDGVDAINQKLSKISNNRTFAENFEARVKKFAEPAMDKCTAVADIAWSDYLDKALLDIYYAQQSKVNEIKQGCFDFVSSCYINADKAITDAMTSLTADSKILINPDKIALTQQMCTDYIDSCNNMFDGNIIADYIAKQNSTDNLDACRAVVRQCFDKYGGENYENFYNPHSGIITQGAAIDWFTLYDKTKTDGENLLSPCAKQLTQIDACNTQDIVEKAFGGFDKVCATKRDEGGWETADNCTETSTNTKKLYGTLSDNDIVLHRALRPTGVAGEVYNQILSNLSTQCMALDGRFVEIQTIMTFDQVSTNCTYTEDNWQKITQNTETDMVKNLINESACPAGYTDRVATDSWGVCSCFHNGGRRAVAEGTKQIGNEKTPVATKCNAVCMKEEATFKTVSTNNLNQVMCTQSENEALRDWWPEGI